MRIRTAKQAKIRTTMEILDQCDRRSMSWRQFRANVNQKTVHPQQGTIARQVKEDIEACVSLDHLDLDLMHCKSLVY